MDNSKRLETVLKGLPYPNQMKDIDMSEENAIRFTWRQVRFRVAHDFNVEEVEGRFLAGGNLSILLEALLKKTSLISSHISELEK